LKRPSNFCIFGFTTCLRSERTITLAKCWEIRGCPQEMLDSCPVSLSKGLCLLNCQYAACFSPRNKMVEDPAMIFGEYARRNIKPVKQVCFTCEYYLTNVTTEQDAPRSND
jgi:hypothetical protein